MKTRKSRHKNIKENFDETDIYSQASVDAMLEDDDISPEEAAFMCGYDEA